MTHLTVAALTTATRPVHPQPAGDSNQTCVCADPQVEQLRAMVAAGWDQVEASKHLWGGPGVHIKPPTRPDQAPRYVRARLASVFAWLQLPKEVPTS